MKHSDNAHLDHLALIQKAAEGEGLHFFGVSDLDVAQDFERFEAWLNEHRHGGMTWLTDHKLIRREPQRLLENAKVALIFGFPYYLGDRWQLGARHDSPRVAQYARLRDYHKFMRSKLTNVIQSLSVIAPAEARWRVTVDSAPLLERALANGVGQAFIGKNTCVIHPAKGSFFLLGEILSTWIPGERLIKTPRVGHLPRSESGGCGTCKRCQVHCPTGALDQDYRMDAKKCLSYWTIEWRGEIPVQYWPWIGRYVFGCDICQLVCPYNRSITPSASAQKLAKIDEALDLLVVATMDQEMYERLFAGTPMTRVKRGGLRRNAIIALAAQGDRRLEALLDHLSKDQDPVISATAMTAKTYLVRREEV
jgi:epoxyqueuosine reductase